MSILGPSQWLLMAVPVLCAVLTGGCTLIARQACREAVSSNRQLRHEIDYANAEVLRLSIQGKRIEGRQAANKRWDAANERSSNGLPDPTMNPDAWRAAVVRQGVKSRQSEEH